MAGEKDRPAVRKAREAVDKLFSDTSVAQSVTLTDLRELVEHIEVMIEGLEMSQAEKK